MTLDRALDAAEAALGDLTPLDDFVLWSEWALARVGFRPSNCLPVVAICRDELMGDTEDALSATWGRSFNVGSLAGMVLAGRTGLAAALGHVPGEDGRHRFTTFSLPHIGIDEDGVIGRVQRRGMHRESSACGALVGLLEDLADGPAPAGVDPDDVERSLLHQRVASVLEVGRTPSLVELTETVRDTAVDDIRRYIDLARAAEPVDVAYLSGIVVHLPGLDDHVARVCSDVVIDGVRIPLPH